MAQLVAIEGVAPYSLAAKCGSEMIATCIAVRHGSRWRRRRCLCSTGPCVCCGLRGELGFWTALGVQMALAWGPCLPALPSSALANNPRPCTWCWQIYIGECVLANELLAKTKVRRWAGVAFGELARLFCRGVPIDASACTWSRGFPCGCVAHGPWL